MNLLTHIKNKSSWIAAFFLLVYTGLSLSAWSTKTVTFDEPAHMARGYAYWAWQYYAVQPENGHLPQRIGSLPLYLMLDRELLEKKIDYTLPIERWAMGRTILFELGYDADKLLFWSRASMSVFAVALGFLIFFWSRKLFGAMGGLISLLLFSFCPLMLAHGTLVTSDFSLALFFLASLFSIWHLLHHVCIRNIILTGISLGGLSLSKMSAPLIVPVAFILIIIRLWFCRPLTYSWRNSSHEFFNRGQLSAINFVSLIISCFLAWTIIWSAYNWKYDSVLAESHPEYIEQLWNDVLEKPGIISSSIKTARSYRFLPEAYLYGFAKAGQGIQERVSFIRGHFSLTGWWYFFPYAFLIKTPLSILFLLVLSLFTYMVLIASKLRKKTFFQCKDVLYDTAPLWVFFFLYSAVVINSNLNIGIRHIIPIYTFLYVLAGILATVKWRVNELRLTICGVLLILILESVMVWPNYLAYFNQTVGGSSRGYHHLVDSSLDWGQDLPELKRWISRNFPEENERPPIFISYFGNGNLEYEGITATKLPGYSLPRYDGGITVPELSPGLYVFSATMLQGVYFYTSIRGPYWDEDKEKMYRFLRSAWIDLQAGREDPEKRKILLQHADNNFWRRVEPVYSQLQTARIANYLRQIEPIDQAGHSILIFYLSHEDLLRALN